MPALETLTGTRSTALDPFGVLTTREKRKARKLAKTGELPLPGSRLPVSWEPVRLDTPRPRPARAPITVNTVTNTRQFRCWVCTENPAAWVVIRNQGRYNEGTPNPGNLLCSSCYNRRVQFTNRYSFRRFSETCEMLSGGDSVASHVVIHPFTDVYGNRIHAGMSVCNPCALGTRIRYNVRRL